MKTAAIMNLAVSGDVADEGKGSYFLLTPCEQVNHVRLVIAGHSHVASISRSLVAGGSDGVQGLSLKHGIAGLRGGPVSPEYWNIVEEIARDCGVAVVWNGNQHNADFLIAPEPLIDFLPRSYPDHTTLPGSQIVPEAMIREHFRAGLEPLHSLLKRIPPAESKPRLLVGTPPPLRDNELIRQRIAKEPLFVERARSLGMVVDELRITPPSVRRKLWFTLQDLMAEAAEVAGWRFVPVPAEVFDEAGFLRPELSAGDVTHANLQYGALMVRQIAAAVI